MKEFTHFYRWGLNMKQHMAIYTMALIFFRGVIEVLLGHDSISILMLVEMTLTSMVIAIIESALFPDHFDESELQRRTILWVIMCNLLFIGAAVRFQWFADVPLWGECLLIVILEGGLFAMWFGVHVAQKIETRALNQHLHDFQKQ